MKTTSNAPSLGRRHWTYADLQPIPSDHSRYEIIDGEIVVTPAPSPSPDQREIAAQFFERLRG